MVPSLPSCGRTPPKGRINLGKNGTGNTSPRQLTKVECKTCPWVDCAGVDSTNYESLNCKIIYTDTYTIDSGCTGDSCKYGIRLKSSGGQVTSCSCPEGFKLVKTGWTSSESDPNKETPNGFRKDIACEPID